MSTKKQLQSQAKEIIAKVYHRMKYEAEHGVEKLTDARWRTSQAVGVSESTITRILKEERLAATSTAVPQNVFKSPSKRKRSRPKSKLDDFDMAVLRTTMMSFHTEFREIPTLRKVKQVLTEKIGFAGCIETLRTILREAGYEWTKMDDNRTALVEKHDIQMLRFKYLEKLNKFRDEGRYIVYTGESYVTTATNTKIKGVLPLQKELSKSTRVIIVHAGGRDGFIPKAFFMHKANSTSGDYHDNMNFDVYENWLATQLLPNLPEKAVIVRGNAPYQNVLAEDIPNYNSNKDDMQAWLAAKNIPFKHTMKKIELYDLILKNKDRYKKFIIDEVIKSKGFDVLQLPPYHPELNPMEKIWGILKNDEAFKNVGQNLTSIMALIDERIQSIDRTIWENTCQYVEDIEKFYSQYCDMENEFIIYANQSYSDDDFMNSE